MAPEELEQQRVAFGLEQGITAANIGVAASVLLALAAAPATGPLRAGVWAVLMITVLLMRKRVLRQAKALLAQPGGLKQAQQDFAVSSLVLAFTLGVLPAIGFPTMSVELRMVLTVFLCCWACVAMASLGVSPRLYTGYLVLVLGGLAIGWARSRMPQAPYSVAAILLYILVLRAFSQNFNRRIAEGIAIRAENADLVRQLSAANEAKTRFIMAASHDLRQPLHAISYLGGVLARATDPGDMRAASHALTSAVEGLNKLFSAILDLSRIESGAMRTNRVAFSVDRLVAQLDAEFRALCVAAGRRWECQVENATALSDPALLERVLRNLLDNAMKHGRQGLVRLAAWPRDGEVVITVSDTGPGIPEEARSRVFDEFYRVNESGGPPGLGLGLSIVRRLVDRLGCRIALDYTDPVARTGTTITLHVPRARELRAEPPPALPSQGAGDEDIAGLAVLVIDDDPVVLQATRALLDQWQCRVATCADGPALERVMEEFGAPDVALVDYQLGDDVSGLELVDWVRARHPGMGVVMVTGESDEKVLDRLAESGLPVLEKPVSPRELRLTLSLFKAAGE